MTSIQKRKQLYHRLASHLLAHNIDSVLLHKPWGDVHFIAYSIDENILMQCYLSPRYRIEKRLEGKDIMLAFQVKDYFYFIEHDLLIDHTADHTNYLNTNSWEIDGKYETSAPNSDLLNSIEEYKI